MKNKHIKKCTNNIRYDDIIPLGCSYWWFDIWSGFIWWFRLPQQLFFGYLYWTNYYILVLDISYFEFSFRQKRIIHYG